MDHHFGRWELLKQHGLPSITGIFRMLLTHPVFCVRLTIARIRFFAFRTFRGTLLTPDNYLIQSEFQLIAYWSFFVERECWSNVWIRPLREEAAPVILDVGANAGLFSHLIWKLNPAARIIAFEPLPQMAANIAEWGNANGAHVTVINKAVSAKPGLTRFFLKSECDTTASLYNDGSASVTREVEAVTLDQNVDSSQIFLIKIDVEGAEADVIAGGRITLSNSRFLLIEAHNPAALETVRAALGGSWGHTQVGASDYLFSRIGSESPHGLKK